MKSISVWKISAAKSSKKKLDELYLHKKTSHELHIACLYNLPSYRTGIIGYVVTLLCNYLPKTYVLSASFERFRWWSDADIFSRSICYLNRLIPILNYGTWNAKQHFLNYNSKNSIFKYGGENNKSLSGMFTFCEPFFDSGCAILSNTPAFASDFVPFDSVINRGMLWSYYNDYQILVITISTNGNAQNVWDEMLKIRELQKQLSTRFVCKNSYIIGDFKSLIYEQKFYELFDGFKINCIAELSATTYLIHDYVYTPQIEHNVVKINPIATSPPYLNEMNDQQQEEIIVMSPIKETVEITDIVCESVPPNTPKSDEKTPEDNPESQSSTTFPYVIFNYFSSNKTPPSMSPPSMSPPSQSPKSDDGWSKV